MSLQPRHTKLQKLVILGFLILASAASTSHSIAQDAIPEATLKHLKDATVFIRVDQHSRSSTGSGFLIGKRDRNAYIITNEHVVRQRGHVRRRVEVDFSSGSKNRKTFVAEVLSEDRDRDLAVLRILNKDLPDPIKLKSKNKVRETLPVFMLGFPFGDALSTNKLGPNVTIGKGTISSIRTDDYGSVEHVQVDGDLNPGNSGGPIVFADGSMMGVSVATVVGTQIGLGIPGDGVRQMLFGRIGALGISQNSTKPRQVTCKLTAALIDPLENIKSVSFLYIESKKIKTKKFKPDEKGVWSKIASRMKEVKLVIDGQSAAGKTIVKGDHGENIEVVHQIKFVNGKGESIITGPGSYVFRIPEKSNAKVAKKDSAKKDSAKKKDKGWLDDENDANSLSKNEKGSKEKEGKSEGWLGGDSEQDGTVKLKPEETDELVAGAEFKCLDAQCHKLSLEPTLRIPNLLWDEGHEHFFVLSESGVLRKIAYPELREVAKLDLESKCKWIEMSKEGLCVLNTGLQDLVLVDPDSLQPLKKFAIGEAEHFAASPASSVAYVSTGRCRRLNLIDLSNGKQLGSFTGQDFDGADKRVYQFCAPALSPDGNFLFCVDSECMVRFRVRGNSLIYEEKGPRIGSNARKIVISPDSGYVALPSGGGNGKGYKTYVYSVDDIKDRVLAAEGGAYPRTIAFDKTAKMIYGQKSGVELLTFNSKGLISKSYDLVKRGHSDTTHLLVHPDGFQVIVLTAHDIYVVKLPKN